MCYPCGNLCAGHGEIPGVLPRRVGHEGIGGKDHRPIQGRSTRGAHTKLQTQRRVRRWVSLAYSQGATPTLTLTSHPGEEPDGRPIQLDQVGITHISFGVHNVKALADDLTAKGYELAGPAESFTNATGEMRSIYVFDPDGILVQFNNPDGGS